MPLRKSLLAQLMAISVLVVVCSIGATAWLAVQSTTRAIQHERGQVLADDASVYNQLVEYAAVHRDWAAVGPLVRDLAEWTGRRIVLTSKTRRPIADSAAATPPPPTVSAVIDPLRTDAGLLPDSGAPAGGNGIDSRATGPCPIVLQLAHAHGGTVTVTSTPGVGSVFALRLPRGVDLGPDTSD